MNALLKIKGFLPFLFVMFINASVDLAHKITIQNALNKCFDGAELIILTALVNAMILLPFIFLFSAAGFINDKFPKTLVIRYSASAAIFLSALVLLSYVQGWFIFAFVATFLLAVQSAIYSPAKYGLIKSLAGVENLSLANGVIQALTIVAILLSSLLFSGVFELYYLEGLKDPNEVLSLMIPIGFMLVALSMLEAFFAFKIPFFAVEPNEDRFEIKKYLSLVYLRKNMSIVMKNRDIWLSIIGLSIFWAILQMINAAFGAHYKATTGDNDVVAIQGIMALSAIGIVVGSYIAGASSKRHIELGMIPIGALGLFLSLMGFTYSSNAIGMSFCSLLFGFFGGLAIVPLNSVIQYFSRDDEIGKVLAGNNFAQNCAMVLSLVITVAIVLIGFSTTGLFTIIAIATFCAALYAIKLMPHLFARILLFPILRLGYKTDVQGIENIPPVGGALLLGNHISWIDWLVLQLACPRALKFVMFKGIYDKWYLRSIFKFFNVIPIAGGASKSAIESIRARLLNGEVVALFPEGLISYNGQIGKFERGFEVAIEGLDVPIVPFFLRGLWGSSFSRASGYYKSLSQNSGKREIIIAFGAPLPSAAKANEVKSAVVALSVRAWDLYLSRQKPLHYRWLERAKNNLFSPAIVDQASNTQINNAKLLASVILFVKKLKTRLKDQQNVGVLLPSSSAGAIVNLALFALGKKPINLNYTVNKENLISAVEQGEIKSVIASKTFGAKLAARGFDLSDILQDRAIYAEEIKESIGKVDMTIAFFTALTFPVWLIKAFFFTGIDINETATILFSSGSESAPKGVELTHKNLLANVRQVADLLNFRRSDVVLNSLPIFHSFGLTITTLLPLSEGVLMIAIPDPTDAAAIGKMCFRYRASILLGTSTFFRIYLKSKKLDPLMLESARLVVAGAEKLREDVKQGFRLKFGLDILEGYGATETAPVVCVNMPNALESDSLKTLVFHKEGSVGLPLPGTIVKIVDPDTMRELSANEDGLIIIGGPQVMKGYYKNSEKTDEAIVTIGDWRYYKSGDKGHIDEDGFITIVDRYSRFAKIGGEMISLTSVESQITALFKEEIDITAIALSDSKKGEKIVALFSGAINEEDMLKTIRASQIAPLMIPSEIYKLETLPKLASGKADVKAAKSIAQSLSEQKSGAKNGAE
ncbi:MAG: acyl-[ACP]--phospholipid O-acyltransferase [Helicobacteraceae bacterium]|jgi:acyl-[acyl-carrier-protein]-phospholipid O-acyltransferase/long-chain-fatty-acid--[acyl-carrier-protein] ligase|nr:acyl-[ACP]--phospholipid O-acyltransferase [Helicobacteraceae bacterium]